MKTVLTFMALLLLVLPTQQQTQPDQVIEIFRHGARGPLTGYDPQWSSSELGQLTTNGMVQQYNLGKALAQKYPNLVAGGYNPDDVYVLSNYVERCIESATVQVASMFRGTTSTITKSNALQDKLIAEYTPLLDSSESTRGDYVPIKVNVVSGTNEELIFNGRDAGYCNKISDYQNENKGSSKMTEAWTIFKDPANQANTNLDKSQKITSMSTLATAYDAFIADEADDKTLPGGITDTDLVESLGYGQAYYTYVLEQNQKIQRELTSFNTIQAVLDQMANFRAGKNAKKLALYSGHDKNIEAVLAAFGVITGDCVLANYDAHTQGQPVPDVSCEYPGFASHLIFEFYNDPTSPYVKVYYNDNLVSLCNGQDSCSYSDFKVLAESAGGNNTLESWDKECGSKISFCLIFS